MKHFIFFALLFVSFSFSNCKKCDQPQQGIPACIQAKIDAFKQLSYAESVIKISNPDGDLYWFVNEYADGGEEVLNEDCELVCTADCECAGSIVLCDGTQLDFPQVTIWHK